MHKLIITALQESRIKRTKGLHTLASKSCSERHRMLFGNANIKNAAWKASFYLIKASARRHRRCDGDDPVGLPPMPLKLARATTLPPSLPSHEANQPMKRPGERTIVL